MVLRLQAIRARLAPIGVDFSSLIAAEIGGSGFAGRVIDRMSDYPPQVGAAQSLGRKFGARQARRRVVGVRYRRTGTLGRNWRLRGPRRSGDALIAEAANATDYAVYVEGDPAGRPRRRQVPRMAEIGWPNIVAVGRAEWKPTRAALVRILQQRDPRVDRRRYRI